MNLGERRDPDGTYFMVGTRMLEKAKQIWSLSDGETNYEELSLVISAYIKVYKRIAKR